MGGEHEGDVEVDPRDEKRPCVRKVWGCNP